MSYQDCIKCGWKTGVHDTRPFRYQHPWLAVHRESNSAVGCWSREEARQVLAQLRAGETPATGCDGISRAAVKTFNGFR